MTRPTVLRELSLCLHALPKNVVNLEGSPNDKGNGSYIQVVLSRSCCLLSNVSVRNIHKYHGDLNEVFAPVLTRTMAFLMHESCEL